MGIGRDILYAVGAAASSPIWGASLLRTGKWRTDWPGRFGHVGEPVSAGGAHAKPQAARTLLIHAVSVGEVNLIRRLVDELQVDDPGLRIVISSTTNTGLDRAKKLYGASHRVVRYPLDFSGAVRRFLDAIRPDAVALVELEVWPNFVEACDGRGIPVVVINGRLSERSFKRYRLARPMLRSTFARLAAIAAQTPEYAQRFEAMGVPADKARVLDTMKWDAATLADDVAGAEALASEMGIDRDRPLVVLGSTGDGEEAALVAALRQSCSQAVQILVVPRKPERFDEVAKALPDAVRRTRNRGGSTTSAVSAVEFRVPRAACLPVLRAVVNRTGGQAASGTPKKVTRPGTSGLCTRVDHVERPALAGKPPVAPAKLEAGLFLLDTLGELRQAYALADVVIVGRSFNGWGGSDPIEPVALGKPTLVGPDHHNFSQVVSALAQGGGVRVVDDPIQAARQVQALLSDPARAAALAKAGREVILSRQGSTRRHAQMLREVMGARGQGLESEV